MDLRFSSGGSMLIVGCIEPEDKNKIYIFSEKDNYKKEISKIDLPEIPISV